MLLIVSHRSALYTALVDVMLRNAGGLRFLLGSFIMYEKLCSPEQLLLEKDIVEENR